MTNAELFQHIKQKQSFLCIGLDPDLEKFPKVILENRDIDEAVFEFNKSIVEATHHLAVAYKPNTAFYEALGLKGWKALEKTMVFIKENYPDLFLIADAKRGDIGHTSTKYAQAFFDNLKADGLTVSPYMGEDSVAPFLEFKDKHTILLALTSNAGAFDFQVSEKDVQNQLYHSVLTTSQTWKNASQLMYVIGGTKPDFLRQIRATVPDNFFLIPGIGAQGGDLEAVFGNALNDQIGVLVNSTRGIIYASQKGDFAQAAALKAREIQQKMQSVIGNL